MYRFKGRIASLIVSTFIMVKVVSAQTLPTAATPESVGLSSAQLDRVEAITRTHIEAGILPGAIMLVARDGKVAWSRVLGFQIGRAHV